MLQEMGRFVGVGLGFKNRVLLPIRFYMNFMIYKINVPNSCTMPGGSFMQELARFSIPQPVCLLHSYKPYVSTPSYIYLSIQRNNYYHPHTYDKTGHAFSRFRLDL